MHGKVYFDQMYAGIIKRGEGEYHFTYDPSYLSNTAALPISLTLPLRSEPYVSRILFPFFDGLIPEGWLLNLAVKNWKLNPSDRYMLLLTVCNDCIGAVRIIAEEADV